MSDASPQQHRAVQKISVDISSLLLLLLFFSGFWHELSGWACSLHAACWLNKSSLLVLILEQQNSTNQKKTGQNGERIVRTFHVNIFSHLFRPKLLWKTNLKRIKSYRIYISSNSRPEQVTEVIFIKYLWEENSLFLYKLVNFFKTLRRNITGDFLDGPVLLWCIRHLPKVEFFKLKVLLVTTLACCIKVDRSYQASKMLTKPLRLVLKQRIACCVVCQEDAAACLILLWLKPQIH